MPTLLLIEIGAALWALLVISYVLLLLYSNIVGLHEDDSLHISTDEGPLEAEQREVVKRMTMLEKYSHKLGVAASTMTVILVGTFIFSAAHRYLTVD